MPGQVLAYPKIESRWTTSRDVALAVLGEKPNDFCKQQRSLTHEDDEQFCDERSFNAS